LLALFLVLLPAAAPALAQTKVVPQSREDVVLSFAPVVKQVEPAVVNIYTKRVVNQRRQLSPLFDDPLFKRFFGEDFGLFGMPRERVQNSLGSGVVVGADGLIVTNYHVIEGADEITVVLSDRREFEAQVVLQDERTDLTILRIDTGGEALRTVELGDSDAVEVGDLVLAIGNPFGVGQTVTSGIVSALARTQTGITDYSFFIQTDAAINPGNSGGALVTLDGKLIGINTAIFSRSGGSIGIGFAIPSNMVRTVIASAIKGQRVVRPWVGLTGQTLTRDLAEGFGLDRPGGVIVSRVHPDGPAARAGLRKGDVILGVDGQPIEDLETLRYRIATRELGEEVQIDAWRDKAALVLRMAMDSAPEIPPRAETQLGGRHPLTGATVANLSPALSEELNLPGMWEGVIVTDVAAGAPAQRLGFRPGDIIVAINGREIVQIEDLGPALNGATQHWTISFSRGGRVRTVEIGG